MKKAIKILAVCSLLLTACGQTGVTESKAETVKVIVSESTTDKGTAKTSSETLSSKEEKDTSKASTTTLKTSTQTTSTSSKPTSAAVTVTVKTDSSNANGYSNQEQNNSVQNNRQSDTLPSDNVQSDNSNDDMQQNNQSNDDKPRNNEASVSVTTTEPAVTSSSITTAPKPQTIVPQSEPPEASAVIIEDTTSLQSVLNYVNSLGRTTDEYYNVGAGLSCDGSDYEKAEAVYNWIRENVSGNCQVFSVAAMYACKGAGLECRYAFFSTDDWYGHMANLVCVDGRWYVFDTQGGRFLKSDKYGEITRIFDENDNTIDISVSESAYR